MIGELIGRKFRYCSKYGLSNWEDTIGRTMVVYRYSVRYKGLKPTIYVFSTVNNSYLLDEIVITS